MPGFPSTVAEASAWAAGIIAAGIIAVGALAVVALMNTPRPDPQAAPTPTEPAETYALD